MKREFNVAIIDEASQLIEAATVIMIWPKLKCLVLAGDNKQLPATVISLAARDAGYDRSLFDRLLQRGFPSSLLTVQYRMHPQISAWPNRTFYGGQIIDGDNVTGPDYLKFWHAEFPPLSIYDIRGEEEKSLSGSIRNRLEAEVAVGIVRSFYELARAHSSTCTGDIGELQFRVGVITPYTAQQELLTNRFSRMPLASTDGHSGRRVALDVVCRTVDGFQGQECDIILFVAVRSNETGSVGFLRDERRLNVALTRAKYSLIVIGNKATLMEDDDWRDFLTCSEATAVVRTSKNCTLVKEAATKVARERIRLDKLRDPTSELFEMTLWKGKVSFTQSFMKSFKAIQSDDLRFRIIDKLLQLASGIWPKTKRSTINTRPLVTVSASASVSASAAASTATSMPSTAATSMPSTAGTLSDEGLLHGIVFETPVEGTIVVWFVDLQVGAPILVHFFYSTLQLDSIVPLSYIFF
jgi:senataxin